MSDSETVLALEATWSTAPMAGDLDTVSSVVADDWVSVAPTGQSRSKRDLLEMLASRPGIFSSVDYSEVELSLFGDTAVVTSFFQGVGKDVELKQRNMRVYAKRDEEWRYVATQIVFIPG